MQRELPQLIRSPRVLALLGCLGLFAIACASTTGSVGAVLAQSKDDGRLTVREVPPGLPAAGAGILVGDEVILIDGRDVRAMPPEEVHRSLEGDVGSTVRLTLLRGGHVEHVEVRRGPLKPAP